MKIKINEIFKSIQGEGKYTGKRVLFIRTSGCTRQCDFCDTQYHNKGKMMTVKEIIKIIKDSGMNIVVWTGGEPMMWEDQIYNVIIKTSNYKHHLETNGDLLPESPGMFQYIGFSPKGETVANNVKSFCYQLSEVNWDIKVVTDLKLNKELIKYATILMPLSTYDKEKDKKIQQNVWQYCIENQINYAQRIHVDVWGKTIGK